MTPALRNQLFERWKELRDEDIFRHFLHRFEYFGGRIHFKVDGIGDAFVDGDKNIFVAFHMTKLMRYIRENPPKCP